jgi:hypothetical protein
MKLQFTLHASTSADCVLAEDDAVLCRLHGKHAQVKKLVMQRAQR